MEIINESNKKYAKQRIDSTIGAIGLCENEREKNWLEKVKIKIKTLKRFLWNMILVELKHHIESHWNA